MQHIIQNPGQPTAHRDKMFSHRSNVYKFGLVAFFISFGFFFLGFCSSNWIQIFGEEFTGLWNVDCPNHSVCSAELLITRFLFALCGGGYVVAFGLILFENMRKVDITTYYSRRIEWTLLVTGALCVISVCVFNVAYVPSLHAATVGWSRTVTILSFIVLAIGWILLACGNRRSERHFFGIVLDDHTQHHQNQGMQSAQQPLVTSGYPPQGQICAPLQPAYPVMNPYQPTTYRPVSQYEPPLPPTYPSKYADNPPPYSALQPMPQAPAASQGAYSSNSQMCSEKEVEAYSKASAPPM